MSNTEKKGKYRRLYRSFPVFFLLMVFISGCSNGMKQYVRPGIDLRAIRTIAVLPLENFTSDKYAGGKIRSKIIIELLRSEERRVGKEGRSRWSAVP